MTKRRQFYTYKFESARLKQSKYNINMSFDEAIQKGEVIALFDNQFLRSIRNIKKQELDLKLLDELIVKRDVLKKKSTNKDVVKEMKRLTEKINNILYVPEYITVVIEHNSHYRHIFENGLILNGKKYVRFSSSAGQGRKKTIVMIEEEIGKELYKVLNNDRKEIKLAPSKFNAYFGLNSSATQIFTTPNITIIPDYYSSTNVKMNWVTETDWESDDIIEIVERTEEFNRFDGMGLVTPNFAKVMADDLGLDYTPAQFCIRQNFTKGMICVFDILDFCKKKNNGNTVITDIYGTEVDLKDVDIILTESMCKLWNAFDSTQDFVDKCAKNKLDWGVSIYTPKEKDIKNILKMNYQFIQTLNLDDNDIEELCSQTVDWLQGVSGDNIDYTKLFLMGTNPNIDNYNNYMYKCLFAQPELINDKYIVGKIKDLLKNKIEKACLGEIYVDGNFQVIVSDPYALMQHCCGLPVTGLLDKGTYFSHYWNKRNVTVVDSMRSPMTYRSEHVILDLVDNEEVNYWYKHCYCGILVNAHGSETMNWSGSDLK